jgi:DNA-binding transcriptional MocR family regulator
MAPKYVRAAETVRAQIADGALKPGSPAPSGEALSRTTGYSVLTCRRALNTLIGDGILVPGPTPNSRALVADPDADVPAASAARELSAALAARRHAAVLTQPELASLTGYSTATVAGAETGRARQSRRFWDRADDALNAGGELLRLFDDARRTAAAPAGEHVAAGPVCVLAVWADGSAAVLPPHLAALVASWLRGAPRLSQGERKAGNPGP